MNVPSDVRAGTHSAPARAPARVTARTGALAIAATLTALSVAHAQVPPAPDASAAPTLRAPDAPTGATPATDPAAPPPPGVAPLPGPTARRPAGPPPPPAQAAVAPSERFEARVRAYLLTPEADVAGLLLDDGRQVRLPPHVSAQLAGLVKPGQKVRVMGLADRGDGQPGIAIEALADHRRISDTPPSQPPTPPADARAALAPMKASGKVTQVLLAPRGEPEGVLLDSGEQVAFPPHTAWRAAELLTLGTRLDVTGYGRRSDYGTVVQATTLARPGSTPIALYSPVNPH